MSALPPPIHGYMPCWATAQMGYWTVDNMPEDVHTYNKVSILNRAQLPTVPVYSLIVNGTPA